MDSPTSVVEKGSRLIRRLHQLSDRKWMSALIEEEIFQTTGQRRYVEDYCVKFSKVYPASHLAVFLHVFLRTDVNGECQRQGISLIFREEHSNGPTLYFFPQDPVLQGLSKTIDPTEMEAVFCEWGEGVPNEIQTMNYKPELSCAVKYAFSDSPRLVFGKVCQSELCLKYSRNLVAASEASASSGGAWRAPSLLKTIPEWGLILQEGLRGEWLGGRLAESRDAAEDLKAVASALAGFQKESLEVETARNFESLFQEQEKHVGLLHLFFPELGEEVSRIREEIYGLTEYIPQSPIGLSHGDFASWNIVMDINGNSVGVIDFDRLAKAECCYDAAYFLQSLATQSIRRPQLSSRLKELHSVFRNAYLTCASGVSSARLALYEALEITSFVLRNFRKSTLPPDQWEKMARQCLHVARGALQHTRRGS